MQPIGLQELFAGISSTTGVNIASDSLAVVAGGDINQSAQVVDSRNRKWFLKISDSSTPDMFAAEVDGLCALAATDCFHVPQPVGYGCAAGHAWLMLEWLDIDRSRTSDERMGRRLAQMHRLTAKNFGWHGSNFIGNSPQPNEQNVSWAEFYGCQRLGFQLNLIRQNGAPNSLLDAGEELLDHLGYWFSEYTPVPSLLHGDLWAGNAAILQDGQSAIYDPAVYFGDREAEIAMTKLFGGFGTDFYRGYDAEWPLNAGSDRRQELYDLYHILNHANLFGGTYLGRAENILDSLLSDRNSYSRRNF